MVGDDLSAMRQPDGAELSADGYLAAPGGGYLISSGLGPSVTIALLRVKIREIQAVFFGDVISRNCFESLENEPKRSRM